MKFQKPYQPSEKDIKDIIAPPAIKINPSSLVVGERLIKSFFILTYPKTLSSSWLSPVINLAETFDISIFIHPIDTSLALKQLLRKTTEIQAEISERERKGYIRSPALETAYQDIESLRDALQRAEEKLFNVSFYITIYADTQEELKKFENLLTSILEERLVYIKPAIFQQIEAFKSTLPLGRDYLKIFAPLNSGPLSSFFPFISPNLTSNEGLLYGINISNNSLIIFDRFSLENANMVCFGTSGSGKSYSNKLEVLRNLMLGADVIIIDPENEYQTLAESVGGSFLKISLTSARRINPFDLPIVPSDEDPANVFRSHILELTGLLKLMLKQTTPEEEGVLDKALIETYASRDITPEHLVGTPPLLEDVQTILESIEGGEDISKRLSKYTQGSYAGFLNQPTNISLKNRLAVFSLRDLEEELRPIAMYIILHYIWNMIRGELKKRIVLIDEAWWLMKYEDSASFLASLVKRARKYYLGISTITQDVEDFLKSPYGKPILNNSVLRLLLKQSSANIDLIQKTFGLTDVEKNFLLGPEIGEGLFFAGQKHAAIKIIASYNEDQIITTNPEELIKRQ